MVRPSKKLKVLEAAAAIVAEDGAACLSLERVARRAGVSKGGLLYHFPNRRGLLEALVAHHVDAFESTIASDDDWAWASAYVEATLDGAGHPQSAALIAVVAEDTALLASLRERMVAWRVRLRAAARDPLVAEQVFLAADAVWYAGLLGLPTPSGADRAALRSALLERLAGVMGADQ